MKQRRLAAFFAVFFTLYGLLNYYLFLSGWRAIPRDSLFRTAYAALFLLCSLSFFAGRALERRWASPFSVFLVHTGSYWFGAMLYLLMGALALDVLRLVNAIVPFFPAPVAQHPREAALIALAAVAALTVIVLAAGHLNALSVRVREMDVRTPGKTLGGKATLRIVAASDIHLGTVIGERRLRALVDRINALEPDVVLLPGDIVDEDLAPVIRGNLGETLRSIRAPLGVYAVTGNHEFIGGAEPACTYLEAHGITMLRDGVRRLEGGLTIVGREDRSGAAFGGARRKPLEEIMDGVDTSVPVVLMDHQPFGLREAVGKGIDLQLSGHTHHGQLWPLNFITKRVYEVSWGAKEIDGTLFYVSCGVGTWGPPVRTGNRPEILLIRLHAAGGVNSPPPGARTGVSSR
ncbi:MAG TPA: metallophosphoesterase [Bacteroidota bacterium]|nr:metallophosphoesterase [Bacteroidota bacterium]